MFGDRNKTIGIIGLGIIGSRIASVLREEKFHVYVWNRTPKSEPNFVGSPAELAGLTQTIQIFVTDGAALMETINAMLPKLSPKHVIINSATVSLEDTLKAAAICEKAGARFLDCPFTGSRDAAAAGELCYYVGGEPKVYESVLPTLEPGAKEILYIGETGAATTVKIATNMISATTVQAISEALAVTRASGVDPALLQQAIAVNACRSGVSDFKLPNMIEGEFEPHFSLKNMFKDAQFALDLGSAGGLDLPALASTAASMLSAINRGHGERDFSALALNFPSTPDGAAPETEARSEEAPDLTTGINS